MAKKRKGGKAVKGAVKMPMSTYGYGPGASMVSGMGRMKMQRKAGKKK